MAASAEYTFLVELFGKTSELAIREAGLAAANVWVDRRNGPVPSVSEQHWRRELLPLLAPNLPRQTQARNAIATDRLASPEHWNLSKGYIDVHQFVVWNFWQWMQRAGLALRFDVEQWAITPAGQRRLKSEHPCRPGAMDRLRTAFSTEHEDSLNRLDDALTCFESGLPRPAVVLLGLAYEELIAVVLARMEGKPIDRLKQKSFERQEQLRKKIENQPATEARSKALLGLNVADTIRCRRLGRSRS